MSEDSTIIELKNVSLSFTQRQAFFRNITHPVIRNLSFDVKKGETLGIVGNNGCGKSTLLKIISGIYSVDKGKVNKSDISIILQTLTAGYDEQLSGRDNAIISAMLMGKNKPTAYQLDQIKDFSELEGAFEEPIKTYSSGMRARLGFSVATTLNADLLLIDEVLGVGDIGFRNKAEQAIKNKINSTQTIILVSHSMNQLEKLCDRIIWLHEGTKVSIGKTKDVLPHYKRFESLRRTKQNKEESISNSYD